MRTHLRVVAAIASALGASGCWAPDPCDSLKCVKPLVCDSIAGRCVLGAGGGTGGGLGGSGGGVAGGSGGGVAGGSGGGTAGGAGGGTAGGSGGGAAGGTGGGGGAAGGSGGGAGGGTGGGTAGGAGGGSSSAVNFDGGWKIPFAPPQPALIGDGGTTVVLGTGADATSPGKFGGAATGPALSIVYPANGVILPPNTNSIEFHFIPGPMQTLFRFTFQAPTTNLVVYTGCTAVGAGCIFAPDTTFWSSLVAFARGTVPVTFSISGVNAAAPGVVGASASQTIAFGQQDIKGGLYYWNTAGIIQRYDYGFPNAPAQQYLTAGNVGAFACVGCHVLSRQGNRILAGKDIPSPAPYSLLEVVSKTPVTSSAGGITGSANFASFAPDEQHLLTSDGVSIAWRELAGGTSKSVVGSGTMPDWAPDGLHMVYARPASQPFFAVPGVASASISTMHFNGLGWDTPTTLVPFAGQNNYYPAYSPDGNWVVFNRSPSNSESFSNAAPDADAGTVPDGELWAVAATGGTPVRLAAASNPGAISWPKWAPVQHDYSGGKIMWLTFSSARPYGLRLAAGQKTQLWMGAFDPSRIANGLDPTFPAFWLPFQNINTGNHIGQWSLQVPRSTCSGTGPSTCSAGENCINGRCNPG